MRKADKTSFHGIGVVRHARRRHGADAFTHVEGSSDRPSQTPTQTGALSPLFYTYYNASASCVCICCCALGPDARWLWCCPTPLSCLCQVHCKLYHISRWTVCRYWNYLLGRNERIERSTSMLWTEKKIVSPQGEWINQNYRLERLTKENRQISVNSFHVPFKLETPN